MQSWSVHRYHSSNRGPILDRADRSSVKLCPSQAIGSQSPALTTATQPHCPQRINTSSKMPEKIADKISITICGDGGCGKSSITLRLVRSQWTSEYDPTIEDSYSVTRTVDGLSYHLSLTDTAGQEEYRGLWASSNLQSDAFLLVYDITNENSLEGLSWFLDMIEIEAESRIEKNNRLLKEKGTRVRGKTEEGWKAAPIMIIAGNKCDLNESRTVQSKIGWDYARNHGSGFMETSAREMVNIEETFAWIVRKVVQSRNAGSSPTNKGHTPNPSVGQYRNSAMPTQSLRRSSQPVKQSSQVPLNEKSGFDRGKKPWWKRTFRSGCFGR